MSTEVRFLLAILLMMAVMILTNIMFPPILPEEDLAFPDSAVTAPPPPGSLRALAEDDTVAGQDEAAPFGEAGPEVAEPEAAEPEEVVGAAPAPEREARNVSVSGPLFDFTFTTRGARLVDAHLPTFPSMRPDGGPVGLLREGGSALGIRLVAGGDTLSLENSSFEADPADGIRLSEGDGPRTLTFRYRHPSGALNVEVDYTFHPDRYLVDVTGRVDGVERPLVLTALGTGLPVNEADSVAELATMAYVGNHLDDGIRATLFRKVEGARLEEGPFHWVALKSKFFLMAALAGAEGEEGAVLGGLFADPDRGDGVAVSVAHVVGRDGRFDYRLFAGPQEYARLSAMGEDLEEANPYGWKFIRPVVRPIVAVIIWILSFLHNTLNWGYGWVLILFGVLMRILLWPLNQKAMRAQMRNMAVQPLLKEIQTKYKDKPEILQKEMMKLYKEYGFNPLAGCVPMLIPFPVLIALFFVFQNTIEFRGVSFLWLPDLSAKDPFYILPLILAASMFLMQYISLRSMPQQDNAQAKMMMWFMPLFMGFIFMQFAAGLNLYYATSNMATLPQSWLIAKERKKASAMGPVKLSQKK